MRKAFFLRCKPGGKDIFDKNFIGLNMVCLPWELWDGQKIVNPSDTIALRNSQQTKYHNIAKSINPGDWLLVPRFNEGNIYIGRAEAVEDAVSKEAPCYLILDKNFYENKGFPEVVAANKGAWQAIKVEGWRSIASYRLPRWLVWQLFSQGSGNQLKNSEDGAKLNPADVISNIIENKFVFRSFTEAPEDWLTPTAFEYLVADILRCEHPEVLWQNVGGPGDGGVDIAGWKDGELHTLVQCKWRLSANGVDSLIKNMPEAPQNIIATLSHNKDHKVYQDGVDVWWRDKIISYINKHKNSIPAAKNLIAPNG